MPITLKKTIKIIIRNSTIRNGIKKEQEKAKQKNNQAQRVVIKTNTQTQKYSKG